MFSTHGDKFWGNPKMQGIFIIICMLVALPVMIYSIYDSNREEVWIKNDFEVTDGYTIGLNNLSDSTIYKTMINSLDTNVSLKTFHLVPVSKFMKIIESTPDNHFHKIKWTIKRDHKLPDSHNECWISQLLVEKTEK